MKYFLLVLSGILGGAVGGMGMGGGTLLIPMLTIFCGVQQKTAQAINLVSFLPMSVVAIIIHAKNKLIDFKGLWYIIVPATVLGAVGSYLAVLLPQELLGKLFGGFLIILSIFLFITTFRNKSGKNSEKSIEKK